jgi:hypothetical protein
MNLTVETIRVLATELYYVIAVFAILIAAMIVGVVLLIRYDGREKVGRRRFT